MAFLYPDRKPENLNDGEIVQDILQTQAIIEKDVSFIVEKVRAVDRSKRFITPFGGRALFNVLIDVWPKLFMNCEENLRCLDLDLAQAWDKYEHIPRLGILNEIVDGRLREDSGINRFWLIDKYKQYNQLVMPYYDFFMRLSNEERLERLAGKK